jgi:hypothetical protein
MKKIYDNVKNILKKQDDRTLENTDCGMEKTHVDMRFTDGKTEPEFLNILK